MAIRISTGTTVQTTSTSVLWVVREGTGFAAGIEARDHIDQQPQHEAADQGHEDQQGVVEGVDIGHHRGRGRLQARSPTAVAAPAPAPPTGLRPPPPPHRSIACSRQSTRLPLPGRLRRIGANHA